MRRKKGTADDDHSFKNFIVNRVLVLEEDRGTHCFDVVHPRAEVLDCFKSTEASVRRPGKEVARMHCVGYFPWLVH